MKQKRLVLILGFIGMLINVAVLITGCKQANNSSNISQVLEGGAFSTNYNGYYYYSGGIEYMAVYDKGNWIKFATGRTYQGNVIIGNGTSITVTVDASGIRFPNGEFLARVTDKQIISLISSLSVSPTPAD